MRLDPGDELVANLRSLAAEEGLTAGFITGIGSTSQVVMSWLDPETGEYQKRKFDEPMEVANLTGTISISADDGRPFVHLHAVLAPRELIAYAGHVHEARTGLVLEVFVWSFEERLERAAAPDKSFPWLYLPGEPRPDGATEAE
jgi:hypothetical protein